MFTYRGKGLAKIIEPVRFSEHFEIESTLLDTACVLNPTLNVDTRLFIDPMLLEHSQHPELRNNARDSYEEHFVTVIKLLRASSEPRDTPWRNAFRYLLFPEIKGTCLGYGARSVSGSGSGADMTQHIIQTAKEIVDLGVQDPDLFVAMALFEEGFGPDRISDMTTNVILDALVKFTVRVLNDLPVPCESMTLHLNNGRSIDASLPVNPYIKGKGHDPVILVPSDILRALPIATDYSEVADAASRNEEIRNRANRQIAEIWKVKTLKDKDKLRQWALSGRSAFEDLLTMLKEVSPNAYDMEKDPLGEIVWRKLAPILAEKEPLKLKIPHCLDIDGVATIAEQIIQQFRFLIEDRRLSEELYSNGKPRPEKSAQRLFFAVAYAYCKANNLDITPEAETGNGPVDFKVSVGFNGRVLVEIKLSSNTKLVKGYIRQLETYKTAEETKRGYYVVIDVGQIGKKGERLLKIKNSAIADGETASEIIFVDGSRKPSASKL